MNHIVELSLSRKYPVFAASGERSFCRRRVFLKRGCIPIKTKPVLNFPFDSQSLCSCGVGQGERLCANEKCENKGFLHVFCFRAGNAITVSDDPII